MPELVRIADVPYIWAHCPIPCNHAAAIPLDALLSLAGADLTTESLRRRLRCTVCGHQGATFNLPTSPGKGKEWEAPPRDYIPAWARRTPPTWKS